MQHPFSSRPFTSSSHPAAAEAAGGSTTATGQQAKDAQEAKGAERAEAGMQQAEAVESEAANKQAAGGVGGQATTAEGREDEALPDSAASPEELRQELEKKENMIVEQAGKMAELVDNMKRVLADTENRVQRMQRTSESAAKFANQGLVKSLLDVADNLERAAASVAPAALQGRDEAGAELPRDRLLAALRSLHEGVLLTERILLQVFSRNNVTKYNPLGEAFDPNVHNALFELPDPDKEPGTVGVVTKAGYKLHDRVVRPAEVGVVRRRET